MKSLKALSLTAAVNDWLASTHDPRILHVFDSACNLINEHREILSIVTSPIGNGPFNLVVEDRNLLFEHLDIESQVSVVDDQLRVGSLYISMADAKLWNPRPDWESFQGKKNEISIQVAKLPFTRSPISDHQFAGSLFSALFSADIPSSRAAARKLAGLGIGLTPSSDDFLVGAMHAAWIIHPTETALPLTKEIAKVAAPLTTSLSAAWIKSAGRGEAGELWHDFFDSLAGGNEVDIQRACEKILNVGETSGADAMAGFIGTVDGWVKRNVRQSAIK